MKDLTLFIALLALSLTMSAQSFRVRVELSFNGHTTDESPLNTEDEIFFDCGIASIFKNNPQFIQKSLRPTLGRDIWEMGPNSNQILHQTLFIGSINKGESVGGTFAVSDQDNGQLFNLRDFAKKNAEDIIKLIASGGKDPNSLKNLKDPLIKLLVDIGDRKDELIGVGNFNVHPNNKGQMVMEVKAGPNATLVASGATSAALQLTGFNSNYVLKFFLEPASVKPHLNRVRLDGSSDKCGCGTIRINNVLVHDKETKEVSITTGGEEYDWFCCDSEEKADPPEGTNLILVSYTQSNRNIEWTWFNQEKTEVPLLKR